MFNRPNNSISQQKPVESIPVEEYVSLSNVLAQLMAAINNLRSKTFDMMDRTYEIQNILNTHPEYIDKFLPEIVHFHKVWEYAYARFVAASNGVTLEVSVQDVAKNLSAIVYKFATTHDFITYKNVCDQVQKECGVFTSMLDFIMDDIKNKISDLEVDIQIGEHQDHLSNLYPERFKSLIKGEVNVRSYQTGIAIKANQYLVAINSLNKFIKSLDKSKNLISVFQSKQSVLIKQIQAFSEREDKAQADSYKSKLKDLISDFMEKIQSDWANLQVVWAEVDAPASPINDVDADTARHIRKFIGNSLPPRADSIISIYRDLSRWSDNLLSQLNQAKQNGGTQDQRSKWYIGNKEVVEDVALFQMLVEKASAANAAKPLTADQGNGGIVIKILAKIGDYTELLTKYASREIIAELGRGDKFLQESLTKSKIYWSQVLSFFDAYKESKNLVLNTKAFDQAFSEYSDAYNKLLKSDNDRDRFSQIDRMGNIQSSLNSSISAISVKPNIESTDTSIYSGNAAMVQSGWRDLRRQYSEMFKIIPNDTTMQIDHLIENPPDLKGNYVNGYANWYNAISKLLSMVISFAVFYTRVKSLYPLTIGMRSIGSKDSDNVKYIESMHALLSEALSGKSLTESKKSLLKEALVYYPNDREVITANKMHDLAMKGY